MILDLSAELFEEIGCKLVQKDCGYFRAVCKAFGGAVEHLFFSSLVLTTEKVRTEAGLEFLSAIARGETGWPAYIHTLRIEFAAQSAQQAHELDLSDAQIQAIRAALAAMRNIRTVAWKTSQGNPEWERTIICDFLNALPGLDELRLSMKIHHMVDLSLPILSGVKKLKIEDRVQRPYWGLGEPPVPPVLHEISRRLTPKLTTLHLDGSMGWAKLWTLIGAHGTHLTEITTSILTPSLLTYLTSYSGLQRLRLKPDGGSRDASDRLADTFYETALVPHAPSLLVLSCPAVYESRWSFGSHNAAHFAALRGLTALEVSVNAGELPTFKPEPRWSVDPVSGIKDRIITRGEQVEADQDEIDAIVTDLFATVATLPALRSLVILSADTERNRGAWCGNGQINHSGAVDRAIDKAIRKFRSDVPCPPVVRAGYRTYRLQRVPEEHFTNIWGEKLDIRGDKFKEIFVYEQTGVVSRY
ncbi:hypothetical protein DFH06DRAFT_1375095 [Mycena polygramma]|nr:hypothetical protein DFH06DRAFT_1375095 [Mycena polygramma]